MKIKNKFTNATQIFFKPVSWFKSFFEPYYYSKPNYLTELEKWIEDNPILKDYVYKIPDDYKKPSLYNPQYLGTKGEIDADIPLDKVGLNDTGNGINHYDEGDAPKVPIKNVNVNHDNNFSIMENLSDYIGNTDNLPVNTILYAQNENTLEVLMYSEASARNRFRRTNSEADEKRAQKFRSNASKKSRIMVSDANIENNKWGHPNWAWTHLLPVGVHGSEGDRRLGIRWWNRDNFGEIAQFENRQSDRQVGLYWLTRIERVDGETVGESMLGTTTVSGIRWISKAFDKQGEILDEIKIEHIDYYREETENHWNADNPDSQWYWSYDIDDKPVSATADAEEEVNPDDDIFSDYSYSTERYYFKSKEPDLVVSFGNDGNGDPVKVDLSSPEACHCIFCGTTGSGKSVQVVSIISQLMLKNTPQQVQFVGIDPKMTEFAKYKDSPYWAVNPILDTNEASMLSRFALMVSETRSSMFAKIGVRNLSSYNKWITNHKEEAERLKFGFLPHLFLVTDEFASLMTQNRQENEDTFNRIAAECRAQGVHALLATQRPSVDVITGVMKNNFPAKCGLSMGSAVDSSTLMEVEENDINPHQLKGQGDNILKTQSSRRRSQGYFFDDPDIDHINLFNQFNYYKPIIVNGKIVPDISKSTMIKYKRELVRAGIAEKTGNTYTMITKKKAS